MPLTRKLIFDVGNFEAFKALIISVAEKLEAKKLFCVKFVVFDKNTRRS